MVKRLVLKAIKLYQATRVLRAPACRFYPSCSAYASTAIEKHGLLAGGVIAACRLLRCHPLHPGGVDFVPETLEWPGCCLSSSETDKPRRSAPRVVHTGER